MKNNKTLWYCVNGNGQGCIFTSPPERENHRKIWLGEIVGMYCNLVMQFEAEELLSLPVLKWNDEPVMIELELNVRNAFYGQERDG